MIIIVTTWLEPVLVWPVAALASLSLYLSVFLVFVHLQEAEEPTVNCLCSLTIGELVIEIFSMFSMKLIYYGTDINATLVKVM